MRQRVAGRPEADDEDVLAVVGQRVRAPDVERIPARQQAVDLDAPRQREHVGEHAGLDLRDVDRLLLLVDAGLHAVVADAVAGARAHRVVDDDERQRADRIAGLAQRVHLGDLLVERAAVERDAERVDRRPCRPCRAAPSSTSPCRARGTARSSGSRSAPRAAVMRASVSVKPSRRRSRQSGPTIASGSSGSGRCDVDEVPVVERSRESGRSPSRGTRGSCSARRAPALQRCRLCGCDCVAGRPSRGPAARSRRARPRARGRSAADAPAIIAVDDRVVLRRRRDVRAALQQRQRAAADEVDLEAEEIVLRAWSRRRARRAGASTSKRRVTKRLTCGAIATSRFESATGGARRVRRRGGTRPTRARARDRPPRLPRRIVRRATRAARVRADRQTCIRVRPAQSSQQS